MPTFTIFAGPNGSGKSSIIERVSFLGSSNLLDADAIAVRLNPQQPQLAAIAAGRQVLRRAQEYLNSGEDFAIETTLSGTWTVKLIRQAITEGFFVRLVYVCLNSPEQNIQRIHERVAQGRHFVPDEDVRRRYARSLSYLKQILEFVDEAILYDNSGSTARLVAELHSNKIVSRSNDLPEWTRRLLGTFELARSCEAPSFFLRISYEVFGKANA